MEISVLPLAAFLSVSIPLGARFCVRIGYDSVVEFRCVSAHLSVTTE